MSVDIVVPVYGGWEYVEKCIRALLAQTTPARIIVVDDASPDATPERIRSAFPDVLLLRNSTNAGFAVTCNRGIRAGEGNIVILLNSDVIAAPDLVEQLTRTFRADRDGSLGSVAPLLLARDGKVDAFGICIDATLAGFTRFHGSSVEDIGDDVPPSAGPYGALAAYRRSALESVGLLDENFFMYGEELELSLRLSAAGWQTQSIAVPLGTHLGAATIGLRSPRQRYLAGFGRGYTLRRYGILQTRFGLRALLTETIVVSLGLVRSADVAALKGRIAGWRRARGLPKLAYPRFAEVQTIGFLQSLRMRSPHYWRQFRSQLPVDRAQ